MQTVAALYDDRYRAKAAVEALLDEGFTCDEIGVVTREDMPDVEEELEAKQREDAAKGAGLGAFLGSIAGLQATLVAMAVPGIGPIIAGGAAAVALFGTGAGLTAGGLIGALVGAGLPEEEAEYYAEALCRGCVLLLVHADEPRVARASAAIDRHEPVDLHARAEEWKAQGWEGFTEHDEASEQPDEITRGREI